VGRGPCRVVQCGERLGRSGRRATELVVKVVAVGGAKMCLRLRFSLRDLFAWISFYAILVAVVHPRGYTLVPAIGAFAVGTGFVLGYGLISSTLDRRSLRVSYFTCALGVSLEAALVLLSFFPPLFPSEWGPFAPLLVVGLLLLRYFCALAALTVISVGAALCCCRRSRAARWLLVANAPSLLLLGWVVSFTAYQFAVAS